MMDGPRYENAYIEITNVCNLSCPFCPGTSRAPAFMEADFFRDVLGKIRGRARNLYFHVMGEPLMHPGLAHFLELARLHGFPVNITTNGTLVGDAGDILIGAQALRQVNFSLHGLAGGSTDSDERLDDIFAFIARCRRERELFISLRLWNLSERGLNERNDRITRRIEAEFCLDFSIQEQAASYRGIRLARGVFLNRDRLFRWPSPDAEPLDGRNFCLALRSQFAVLVDGTVVPCCLDGEGVMALGNIADGGLDDILSGPRARAIYDGFSRRRAVEELCRRCGYGSLYAGERDG